MSDYEPLDLTQHLNGGLDALGADADAEIGPRHFRGLPFAIGDDPSRCFISLDGDSEPVSVSLWATPLHRIIFAHRLCGVRNRRRRAGGRPRRRLRVFRLANGQRHIVPVRERFEIGLVPTDSFRGASGLPFLAVTDGKHQTSAAP